ncbi:SAM-dependent methyltransferase [Deinobacterium chartae]|uniref:SAM-dependent methyltransferase n=1 Tax=Deinobacterium chartae TaxID=521158 RepID=A0A841I2T6_9DEIO|nr:class I SAM-dependent methyltransferase [Deinobacterium chartae]MBB6099593.1 SAM-dependent methyltransferase [Deinobacterium chartae]
MQRDHYTHANREAWNETAPRHAATQLDALHRAFAEPGYSRLDPTFTALLQRLGLQGRAVAQLACNNGRELLSVLNLGAAQGTGFDIAGAFLEQGRALARTAGLTERTEWVEGDLYHIPAHFDGRFDLVFVTIGALGWLPDLEAFYAVVARLLRPGGHFVAYEMHPLLDMCEAYDDQDPPRLFHSYFRRDPYVENDGLDYYSGERYDGKTSYWFHHTLADIIGGALRAGLVLEAFDEYPHDVSDVFASFAGRRVQLPLSYSLVARRA